MFSTFLFLHSFADEVKPEEKSNDASQTNENVDLFSAPHMSNKTKDHTPTEDMPDSLDSQNSMDYEPSHELDESVLADNKSNSALTPSSNGQKSRRPESPGLHPAKTTCVGACPENPERKLCLKVGHRKVEGILSDVKVLSPDSPVCKITVSNNSDMCDGGSPCTEDSDFEKAQAVESLQVVKDSDSENLAKGRVHSDINAEDEDEQMECSSSFNMSQNLKENQSDASFKGYL